MNIDKIKGNLNFSTIYSYLEKRYKLQEFIEFK